MLFLHITNSFLFSFFQHTLKKLRLNKSYLIWVVTPYHSSLISNSDLFLMENIFLLFTVANTHFQMSADCFFNLQVSSVEIGLGFNLNIWLYRATFSLWIHVLFGTLKVCAVDEILYYSKWGALVQIGFAGLSHPSEI